MSAPQAPAHQIHENERAAQHADRPNVSINVSAAESRWCERCLHPISLADWVCVEAYREVGEVDRRVLLHGRCFRPGDPTYLDARFVQLQKRGDTRAFQVARPDTRWSRTRSTLPA